MSLNTSDVDLAGAEKSIIDAIRAALGASGLVALIVGLVVLFWPGATAMFVAGIIATYALIAGLTNIVIGLFVGRVAGRPRIAYLALGVLFIVAAGAMFANLGAAASGIATLLGIMVGVSWIAQGVAGLTLLGGSTSKVWALLSAAISIVAGLTVLSSPLWGAAWIGVMLGVSLVILGIAQLVRAYRFAK